jgi:hypothetical protein
MAFLQQQLQHLAFNLSERRRCVCNPTSVGYNIAYKSHMSKYEAQITGNAYSPILTCMNPGSNHAAVFFSHSCPFRRTKLWRKPV